LRQDGWTPYTSLVLVTPCEDEEEDEEDLVHSGRDPAINYEAAVHNALVGEIVRDVSLVEDPRTGGTWLEITFTGDRVSLRVAAQYAFLFQGPLPALDEPPGKWFAVGENP